MKKNDYNSPEVEIIEIEVEKGFAQSQQKPSEWEEL